MPKTYHKLKLFGMESYFGYISLEEIKQVIQEFKIVHER